MTNPAFTIWLCGPPRAGKTTLGKGLCLELSRRGLKLEHLDSGELRKLFWPELGHIPGDRRQACLRTARMAETLNRHGVVAVVSQISPYEESRKEARGLLPHFVEVYLECPLETLINRDQSGLYQKALAGEIKNFTGLDDPFEPPAAAEITCPTASESPEESLKRILNWLELANLIPALVDDHADRQSAYTPEEEEKVIARLKDLGYL